MLPEYALLEKRMPPLFLFSLYLKKCFDFAKFTADEVLGAIFSKWSASFWGELISRRRLFEFDICINLTGRNHLNNCQESYYSRTIDCHSPIVLFRAFMNRYRQCEEDPFYRVVKWAKNGPSVAERIDIWEFLCCNEGRVDNWDFLLYFHNSIQDQHV